MTFMALTAIILTLTSILLFIPQPLLFGLIILILTTLFAVLIRFLLSPWYAYSFFIIFIGGLLVMFAYVSALSPNYFHKTQSPSLLFQLLIVPPLLFLLSLPSPYTHLSTHLYHFNLLKTANDLYSHTNYALLILLILTLLMILTLVVKISHTTKGPLRPFNCLLSIPVRPPSKREDYF